jgi:hypothetical protein
MLNGKHTFYWYRTSFLVACFLLLFGCGKNNSDDKNPPPANRAPTVSISGAQSVIEHESLTLNAQASDSDGSIRSYKWTIVNGPTATLTGDTTANLVIDTPDVNVDTELVLRLVVTDNDGATATANYSVTITRISFALTLVGKVVDGPIPDATVHVVVGDESFDSQTDVNGNYSVELEVDESNVDKLIKITATGNITTHPGVLFVSQLASFSQLANLAGSEAQLDSTDLFGLNVSNVTTVESVLLEKANEGMPPESNEKLLQLLQAISPAAKLELAALIKIIVDNENYSLPEGVNNTLLLITDDTTQQNFKAFVNSQDSALIASTITAMIEDEALISWGGENQDFDLDGFVDTIDAFPFDPLEWLDTDADGIGNNADNDDDNDSFADNIDAFPLDKTEWLDTDADGIGNNADPDDDNDTFADNIDAFPLDKTEWLDTDADGIGNHADTDDDNDTFADNVDAFPLDKTEWLDTDADGTGNNADADDDNDTFADNIDAFPLNASEWIDSDLDGIGNNADTDDDNDTFADIIDAFPLNANEWLDTDADGIGNNADNDDDNDTFADNIDAFPLDKTEWLDTDGDGIGNNADTDDDNDTFADNVDAFPLDKTEWLDTDGDGIGNNADTDDDNDTFADNVDAFPLDKTEWLDTDADGIGNNADTDDDNDTFADNVDAFPLDKTEWLDTDLDGMGNNADTDDDNDTFADNVDAFPLDKTEWLDTDLDGMGNNADTDDDNDLIADIDDGFPLIPIGDYPDLDNDGIPDDCDESCLALGMTADDDDNGNGIPDVEENQLAVVITTPESLLTVGTSPITVVGTIFPQEAQIIVNGVEVTNNAGNFSVDVALKEGSNTIEARAILNDLIQTDSITVSLDKTPPYLTIESHQDQQTVYTDKITVTGLVNDIVRGTVEDSQANVTINGVDAEIQNRSYAAQNISLVEGMNTITVTGSDQVGNTDSINISVKYEVLTGKRIELVSGQSQQATIRKELTEPLVVKVVDDNSQPVEGAAVVFRVTQGSGSVGVGTENEGRAIVVETDELGMASTRFLLGARTGVQNQKVSAAVVGYVSQVSFSASATGEIGNKLSVNSGNNQRGSIGKALPEAFVAVVTDAGANVVPNARVKFSVAVGGGKFANKQSEVEKLTDSDGRVSAIYTLGNVTGLDKQRIVATLIDAPQGQEITAGFTASGFVPAESGNTKISGVVLDNQESPIPNVTIRVEDTTREAVSDAQGRFTITQAPVGPVHLIADGSTASEAGEFPSLGYNLVTISGVDNPLSSPIYMVKLDTQNAVYAGTKDVVLELKDYPGFKLEIAKDSVTFPDGSREGYISVTPVNAGTVPMAPPNGMQPQFIVTIQPTGTKFFPPAKLTLPNVDAHAPGAQVEMYSFDHDLEEFVAIGLGTVSEDGTLVTTNPGVGVIKAGWHCGSQPGGQSCAHNCPICQDCDGDCNCVAADGDPRLAGLDQVGDCKEPDCNNGNLVMVNDDADIPDDEIEGDCIGYACVDGVVKQVPDELDGSKCTECGPDGPKPKPDGTVPDDDKCVVCQDGKETKKADKEIGSTTITFAGVKNFIADINKILEFAGSKNSIPEVALEYSNAKKEVCCTQQNGAYTLEETDAGSVVFSPWSASWTPTIPPYSGNYTFTVLGRSIGIAYGIRFTAEFGGKVTISRTKRECTNDKCWGGSVSAEFGLAGGPFGSVPNPASSPAECGPPGDKRPCDLIRLEGTIKTGVNVQAGIDCEKISGSIGHNGITANVNVIVAEGSWLEVGGSASWVLVNSGPIVPLINIPLPN